ncbi:hypothetical protein [Isoptericola rhizosphaerae]|uniref:hypothetical protein n=1 Tax=Isoptericola rhizosphaerae TaxID=3377837 RepID=UPI00383A86EB
MSTTYQPTREDIDNLIDGDAHACGDVIGRADVLVADLEAANARLEGTCAAA